MSHDLCSVLGCERHAKSLGMCAMHRLRVKKHGDAGGSEPRRSVIQSCDVSGCQRKVIAKRLCAMHYARKRLRGDPGQAGDLPRRVERAQCSVSGCCDISHHRGMCRKHYKSARKSRDDARKCSVSGCGMPHEAKGFCDKHYARFKLSGDPHVGQKVLYSVGGKITLKSGYIRIFLGKENRFSDHRGWCLEHRFVMGTALGRLLYDDETVHHKNGDRADNRLSNLELKSGHHGAGQTAHDLLEWAREIISRYAGTLVDDQGTF